MKPAFALLLTDTHLQSSNIQLVKDIFNEAIELCKKERINKIFHLGDFFETRASLSYEVIEAAQNIFQELNNSGLNVYIIAGNHDKPYVGRNSYLTLFQPFYPNIHFVENICFENFYDSQNFDTFEVVFLPNFDKVLKEKLEEVDWNCFTGEKKILLAHHQFTEILVEIQSKFDLILMGHIHDREEISLKAYYIGSAYQQNFSEDNYKGFTILYKDLSLKQTKTKFKEFVTQKVDLNVFTEEEAKKFIKDFKENYPNKFLRIVFEGFNKDTTLLKEYCKSLDVDVTSNIKNLAVNSEETYLSELSDKQLLEYFEEFKKTNESSEEAVNILSKAINKEVF